jgi:cytochrome c oxidase cbb3-type subunit 1
VHTNAVIFAFGGCALFATSLHVVQRTCHVTLFGGRLVNFVFWGWQAVIVLAAITLPMGLTEGKEYAELIWPIDVLIAAVWVSYAVVFFGTIVKRRVNHIYVANWFYGSFILAVAVLHIVNSLAMPSSLTHSYPIYSGAVDAMVQWWYGHNAVGFFLTAGFLGMMYYFVPRQRQSPGVLLPPVDRALLGADRHLHVGRPAPPAVHRDPGLGAVAGRGVLADPAGPVAGAARSTA